MSGLLDLTRGGVDAHHSLAGPWRVRERILDCTRGPSADAGNERDVLDRRGPKLLEGSEVLEQALSPHFAESRHLVEETLNHRLGTSRTVMGDREAVGLIAYALEQ